MQSVTHATVTALLALLCALGVPRPAAAQTPLDAAVGPYAAAAYEEALEALDKMTVAGAVSAPAPASDLATRIFDVRDADVRPPVIERQDISRWVGALPKPRPGTNLSSIEVVIDESGTVIDAAMRASVSRFYDNVLIESSKLWGCRPATRQGRPVKYRRVIAVVMGG